MNLIRLTLLIACVAAIAGCSQEPPPRTVTEFMDDRLLLEAALVRCTQNRSETRYEAECVNAREAVKLIEVREESQRRAELEAQSQRKRDALRRTQQAAAEARRRVAEAERRRHEQEYLEQYGTMPPPEEGADAATDNVPLAVIPEPEEEAATLTRDYVEQPPAAGSNAPVADAPPPAAGSNAPVADAPPPTAGSDAPADDASPPEEPQVNDLESIRDELKRRNEQDNGS